ncbi:MAG TPA: type II secretion system F family protein [Jatrophihabitantaceae bacterium]|nr:type II secretion system F family protein [Jatrophihabitantaceae bacterium]
MGALVGLTFGVGLLLVWRSGPRAPARRSSATSSWTRRRAVLLHQAGVSGVGSLQLLGVQALSALIGGALVLLAARTVTVACCFGGFAFFAPLLVLRRARRRRQSMLRELWPEAIDHLASAVRAGMSLPEGIAALAAGGPQALRAPFAEFGAAYRASGKFGDCLDALRDELADPVGDRVCETMRVARDVGGSDLGSVLRALSELLRADARTRAELETRQGWIVNAARLAVASPWAVLLLLSSQSSTITAYDSPAGAVVLAIGACVCVLAYQAMLRISTLPAERRVLR